MIWHIPNKTNRKPKHIPVLGKNYGRSASQKKMELNAEIIKQSIYQPK